MAGSADLLITPAPHPGPIQDPPATPNPQPGQQAPIPRTVWQTRGYRGLGSFSLVWPQPSWRRNKGESPLLASPEKEDGGGTLEKAPSSSHTRAEDPVPRAPAHQGPEFLQHLLLHEDKYRGNFVRVPARRGNDEKGKETGRDSQRRWRV